MNRESQALIELSEDLKLINDIDLFWGRITDELANFGVTSLMYGAIASKLEAKTKGINEAIFIKTNHPQLYFEGLDDKADLGNVLDNDLSVEHCVNSSLPMIWHEEPDWVIATKKQKQDWFASDELGFQVGITVPTTALNLNGIGGTGLCAGELNPEEFDQMWLEKNTYIMQILGLLDAGMREQYFKEIIGLSPREAEVLVWLANGFRPEQIAHRLNIGYRTVDKYINNAKRKLNAKTRDQAVAKALIFNAIEP